MMKMIMIVYNEALEEDVMELLRKEGQDSFTQFTKVKGKGKLSGPHMMTHIWPKANNLIIVCVENEKAARIMESIRKTRHTVGKMGLKAFMWQIEEVT